MSSEPYIEADYLNHIFKVKSYTDIVDKAIEAIRFFGAQNPYDGIAFCGVSGAAIAFPLSYALKKHLICVRKDPSHDKQEVVGLVKAKRYIIVDDQIETGE